MNSYEAKIEAKRENFKRLAKKARKESSQAYEQAHKIGSIIPFGQPILVGHHSEGRHRRDIEKINNNMRKSIEEDKKAEYYENKAENYGEYKISSDDPEAIQKLKEKLKNMEAAREEMEAINKEYKRYKGNIDSMNISDELKITLREDKAFQKKWGGRSTTRIIGPFKLSNLGVNIRRIKQRIEELEKKKNDITTEEIINNIRIVDNVEDNRVQIFFNGKPADEIRKNLKSSGFRWSPRNGCWQAYRGHHYLRRAKEMVFSIK